MDCKFCGREIYLVEAESQLGCCADCFAKIKEEKKKKTLQKNCIENVEENIENNTSNSYDTETTINTYNKDVTKNIVISKFDIIIYIINFLGYCLSLFIGLYTCQTDLFYGIGLGITFAIFTFFSSLSFEFFKEILKLLEDIKNKL